MSAGCASSKAPEPDNVTSDCRQRKAPTLHSNNHVVAGRACSKTVPPRRSRRRSAATVRSKDQGFHPEHTRGRWGGTTTSPSRGKAAPTSVAATGVNRRLELSLSPTHPPTHPQGSPTPTLAAKGRGQHAYNRASRSESGQGTTPAPDLARNSKSRN